MAEIYGTSQMLRKLQTQVSFEINSFNDVQKEKRDVDEKIRNARQIFFSIELPKRISELEEKLKVHVKELKLIEGRYLKTKLIWDKKIIDKENEVQKKLHDVFNTPEFFSNLIGTFSGTVALVIYWIYSKPKELHAIQQTKEKVTELAGSFNQNIQLLKKYPEQVFITENSKLCVREKEIEFLEGTLEYKGVYGEELVLRKLKELNDEYCVFWDCNIELDNWRPYNRVWNLKSAQMDLIVCGPTGLFLIEVKNWSKEYAQNYRGISPFEQICRASIVLSSTLKKRFGSGIPIIKIIVPINNNISSEDNRESGMVYIVSVNDLPKFIRNGRSHLNASALGSVKDILADYMQM
jgi:hypothetical protein